MQNANGKAPIEITTEQWDTLVTLLADENTDRHVDGVRNMIAAGLSPYAVTSFGASPVNIAEVAGLHTSKSLVFYLQDQYPELVNGSGSILSSMLTDGASLAKLVAGGFRLTDIIASTPNLMDDVCETPKLSQDTLSILVEHGLQLDAPATIRGSTMLALNWLGQTHRAQLIDIFLAAGANALATNDKGRHFLHEAVTEMRTQRVDRDDGEYSCRGLKQILEVALARGVSIDIQDNDGNSPLHLAAKMGYTNKAMLLIDAGASMKLVNKKGKTPAQFAKASKRLDTAHALVASAARHAIMQTVRQGKELQP